MPEFQQTQPKGCLNVILTALGSGAQGAGKDAVSGWETKVSGRDVGESPDEPGPV
jgi:hypothetical protein